MPFPAGPHSCLLSHIAIAGIYQKKEITKPVSPEKEVVKLFASDLLMYALKQNTGEGWQGQD